MKYIVLAIAMSVKNNGIAYSKELVDDSQLNTNASELIRDGFIRNLTEEEKADLEDEFEETGFVDSDEPELTEEEKAEALLQKQKEEEEAAALKQKEADELALKGDDANVGKSAKDIVKDKFKK